MKNILSNITKSVIIAAACIVFAASCSDKEDENAKSSAADIISFTVGDYAWTVSGTDITGVYPMTAQEGWMTPVIKVSEGATVSPKSRVEQNFFTETGVPYRVTAEDGTTKTYTARAVRTKNNSAEIIRFTASDTVWTVGSDSITHTYSPAWTEGPLKPVITLPYGATISPDPDEEQNFFTDEGVRYTVTADDGVTKKTYVAKATRTKYREAEILGFSVGGVAWTINDDNSINYSYPVGTEISNLTPVITLSPGATVTPASRTSQNFFSDEGITYVVTSEDGSATNPYVVKAKIKAVVLLDRKLMSGHPIGNDAPLANSNASDNYYSGPEKLFDSTARSLGTTGQPLRYCSFGVWSPDGEMPIYYTIDLGVKAEVSLFWVETRGEDRNRYIFGITNGGASVYHWRLWGTTHDFADPSSDHQTADDPYWTAGQWKSDSRWIDLGDYYYRRPSNPNATPGNAGSNSGPEWESDLEIIFAPPSITNQMNFSVPEAPAVRYIRWEFIQSWSNEPGAYMNEARFWGIVAE